jgi:hypothetical protein
MRAIRRIGGIGFDMSLLRAVRIVTDAFERRVTMPRSSALDLGRLALGPTTVLDRGIRIRAARAVSPFGELETVKRAVRVIGSDKTPIELVETAAVILLGPPPRKLSSKTVSRLSQVVRRHAIVRGPLIDLLVLAALQEPPSSKGKK